MGVGDKVVYIGKGGFEYDAVIFGIAEKPDFAGREFAISFETDGRLVNITTWKERLKNA